jgi:type I restriction enzyme S subunit
MTISTPHEALATGADERKMPPTWCLATLGELCSLRNGDAYKESDWSNKGTPIIRIQNLNDPTKKFNYWSGGLDDRVVVEKGDVLLAWSGTPGTSFGTHIWQGERGVLNQHIFRVDLNKTRLDPSWAVFAINQQLEVMIGKAHGGVGLRHVTKREVEALQIVLPPIPEQNRIAAILNEKMAAVERARAATEVQLQAAEVVFDAQLRSRFEALKASVFPKVPLGSVCEFIGGMQPPKHTFRLRSQPGYVRLVQIQDFRRCDVVVYIPTSEAKRTFDETDVLIGRYGPPVFQILRGLSGAYNVALMKTAPKNGLTKDYLFFLLQEPGIQSFVIAQSRRSAGQSGVQKEILESLVVPLPPIDEQRRIADMLLESSMKAQEVLKKLEDQRNLIDLLPHAILRSALVGEF